MMSDSETQTLILCTRWPPRPGSPCPAGESLSLWNSSSGASHILLREKRNVPTSCRVVQTGVIVSVSMTYSHTASQGGRRDSKIRSLRESVRNTAHRPTPAKCSPTDSRASRNSVRNRGCQQEAPASPANDRLFHPQQSPGTGMRSDTKKPSFILAARLPSKEKASQDNRFL